MDIEKVRRAKTQQEARDYAIEYQNWQSNQSQSWDDVFEWMEAFTYLANKFDLVEEFQENDII